MREMTRDLVDGLMSGEDTIADRSSFLPFIGGGDRLMYWDNADCGVFDLLL
jgi:hypothetical protein